MNKQEFKDLFKCFAGNQRLDKICRFRCNECQEQRLMDAVKLRYNPEYSALIEFYCRECNSNFMALWTKTGTYENFILLPFKGANSIATKHTPECIAYYLNDAGKSESMSANAAAIAMYRAALDQLLTDQGYDGKTIDKRPMLGHKIQELNNAIKDGTAKKWALNINIDYITSIQKIGNYVMHPDNNTNKQSELDENLINEIKMVFIGLLFEIYEAPTQSKSHLNKLQQTVAVLKK